jgi:hypothetical protein
MPKYRTTILRLAGLFVSCLLAMPGSLMLRPPAIIPGLAITIVATPLFSLAIFFFVKNPSGDSNFQTLKHYHASVLFMMSSIAPWFWSMPFQIWPEHHQETVGSWPPGLGVSYALNCSVRESLSLFCLRSYERSQFSPRRYD